jgi:hypothetical protein
VAEQKCRSDPALRGWSNARPFRKCFAQAVGAVNRFRIMTAVCDNAALQHRDCCHAVEAISKPGTPR